VYHVLFNSVVFVFTDRMQGKFCL